MIQPRYYKISTLFLSTTIIYCCVVLIISITQHECQALKSSSSSLSSMSNNNSGTSSSTNRKRIGTQMTGAGSKSKKNTSIFLSFKKQNNGFKNKNKKKKDKYKNVSNTTDNIKGRMFVKYTREGDLLLSFPNEDKEEIIFNHGNLYDHDKNNNNNNNNLEKVNNGTHTIVSLSFTTPTTTTNANDNEINNHEKSIHAQYWNLNKKEDTTAVATTTTGAAARKKKKKEKKKKHDHYTNDNDHILLSTMSKTSSISSSSSSSRTKSSSLLTTKNIRQEWIPIEGIYGLYNLPSGPFLVLITDSELIYQSPPLSSSSSLSSSLIHLRRIKSMDIVPIPMQNPCQQQQQHKLNKGDLKQLHLLRQSFKEHDFFYSLPFPLTKKNNDPKTTSYEEAGIAAVQDVTHTLQRFFTHYTNIIYSQHTQQQEHDKSKKMKMKNDRLLLNGKINFAFNPILNESFESSTNSNDLHTLCTATNACRSFSSLNDVKTRMIQQSIPLQLYHDRIKNCFLEDNDKASSSIDTPAIKRKNGWWLHYILQQKEESNALQPDSRFFWNEECIKPFLTQYQQYLNKEDEENTALSSLLPSLPYRLLLEYVIPVTSAFVGVQKDIKLISSTSSPKKNMSSLKYDQLLISRRSKYRAGTRFTKRGADGIGDVANFAETEQICIVWDEGNKANNNDIITKEEKDRHTKECLEIYSHVQTRGSIPLRWSSPTDGKTYRPQVLIGTDPLAQARALRHHLIEQLSLYSTIEPPMNKDGTKLVFINLIDKHSDQGRLGRTFGAVLDAVIALYENGNISDQHCLSNDVISHVWFDFHAECKKGRWHRLQHLLDEVSSTLDNQGYFSVSKQKSDMEWSIKQIQNGVIRTNCMDCLDRTNVVQSMFGRYILFKQFNERLDFKLTRKRKLPLEYIFSFKKNALKLPWEAGELSHRLLWADNADAISRLYAGTPALKGDFTRTGKRTKRGVLDDGLNSVTRFYLNNFLDADRQKGMDLLTGFSKFETNDDEESMHNFRRGAFSKRAKVPSVQTRNLNLGWLPGDLESQLRDAALTIQSSHINVDDGVSQPPFVSTKALVDIGRRATLDVPWWIEEDGSELVVNDNIMPSSTPQTSSGHVIGALLALQNAPVATAIAIMFLISPGLNVINS